jgi:tripartite-type tricarboxylate transporter receptor subunit TctC
MTKNLSRRTSAFAAGAAVLTALAWSAAPALAQEAYPSRPVSMVVAFPPGGVADLTGRPLSLALQKVLKQPIVVENRPGAGGGVGNAFVAKAKPDGHTLLMALSSVSIIPEADKVNGRAPLYELNQLAPIALISADPTVLVVRAESPFKTLKDFIDHAKANPAKLNYGSSGLYSALHVPMEMLSQSADIKLFHIPYQGGAPAVTALLGAQVDAIASGPGPVAQHIKAGKLRALATWGGQRLAAFPDVPTLKELGHDVEFYIWAGLFAPAGTPQPVLNTLREAVRVAVDDPQFKQTMNGAQQPVQYLDAVEFQRYWNRDARKMADVVKKIGKVDEKK